MLDLNPGKAEVVAFPIPADKTSSDFSFFYTLFCEY